MAKRGQPITTDIEAMRSGPTTSPAWYIDWGWWLVGLFVALTPLYGAWLFTHWGGPALQPFIGSAVVIPNMIVAGILMWRAAIRSRHHRRLALAWTIMGLAFVIWGLGNVVYLAYEVFLGERPFPSPADALYLAFYPLAFAGLLLFPVVRPSRADLITYWLDAGTVFLGGTMVVWYFLLRPIVNSVDESDPVAAVLNVVYVVGDLVVLMGLIHLTMRRVIGVSRWALVLLSASIPAFLLGDLGFALMTLDETYETGVWTDFGWWLAPLLAMAGAQWQLREPARSTHLETAVERVGGISWFPYLAVATGYSLLVWEAWDAEMSPLDSLGGLILGAIALTALVIVRQIAAVRDNLRLQADNAARRSEARFASLVQNASDMILVVDKSGLVVYITPSIERIIGYQAPDLLGRSVLEIVHPDERSRVETYLREVTTSGGPAEAIEIRLRHATDRWIQVETVGTNLLTDANVQGIVLTSRDIAERKALEEQLTHQAFHDPLTGLANRALFRDHVDQAIARLQRRHEQFAILFLDLDDFKTVNDSLGHASGDELLAEVALRIQRCLRPADTAARFGGDEFAVLLEQIDSPADAGGVAERILAALRLPINLQGRDLFVGASIGIALGTHSQVDADELLRSADLAMYTGKAAGKGDWRMFEPGMHADAVRRLGTKADLQLALDRHEFFLCYQPVIELAKGRISGFEALVRWRHPERGIVPPAEFIGLAEETGLIVPIGQWVLEQACRQQTAWERRFPASGPHRISVNLSARQVQHPDLVQTVSRTISETKITPTNLVLEITETTMMHGSTVTGRRLRDLKALGVKIALDDFGTGYSSLGYLRRFPVDTLKIDKSFVDGVAETEEGATLLRAVVDLGRALHLSIVAEGIEEETQLAVLRAMGCDAGQGFLFAEPLTADWAEVLIASNLHASIGHPSAVA